MSPALFLAKLAFILIFFALLLFIFHIALSRLLKMKRRKFFVREYINDRHKKAFRTMRFIFIPILILAFVYNITGDPAEKPWYFEIWFLAIIFLVVSQAVTIFLEWKYAKNRKMYMITLSELLFVLLFIVSMLTTNFFGLF